MMEMFGYKEIIITYGLSSPFYLWSISIDNGELLEHPTRTQNSMWPKWMHR